MILLIYLLVGAVAGLSAGLFGIGGGVVIVPALIYCFGLMGFDATVIVQLAVGTSLASIVVTSISSVRAHHRLGNVDWRIWRALSAGIALGAVFGAVTASSISGDLLKLMFGVFLLILSAKMLLPLRLPSLRLPGAPVLALCGGGIGYLSSLFGIGGGSLTVPFLAACGKRMQNAVATSAACGLPLAAIGAASYGVSGFAREELPAWSSGFIYWPAFAGIVICSAPCAKMGAALAQRLPSRRLEQAFAAFLVLIAVHFLFGTG